MKRNKYSARYKKVSNLFEIKSPVTFEGGRSFGALKAQVDILDPETRKKALEFARGKVALIVGGDIFPQTRERTTRELGLKELRWHKNTRGRAPLESSMKADIDDADFVFVFPGCLGHSWDALAQKLARSLGKPCVRLSGGTTTNHLLKEIYIMQTMTMNLTGNAPLLTETMSLAELQPTEKKDARKNKWTEERREKQRAHMRRLLEEGKVFPGRKEKKALPALSAIALSLMAAPEEIGGPRPRLSERDTLILRLSQEGLSNAKAAAQVGCATNTVANVLRRMGIVKTYGPFGCPRKRGASLPVTRAMDIVQPLEQTVINQVQLLLETMENALLIKQRVIDQEELDHAEAMANLTRETEVLVNRIAAARLFLPEFTDK